MEWSRKALQNVPSCEWSYFVKCPVFKVSGRMFPVDVIWKDGPTSNAENYLQEAVSAVQDIHRKEGSGDILVFLTSPMETECACEKVRKIEPDQTWLPSPSRANKGEFLRMPLASAK